MSAELCEKCGGYGWAKRRSDGCGACAGLGFIEPSPARDTVSNQHMVRESPEQKREKHARLFRQYPQRIPAQRPRGSE